MTPRRKTENELTKEAIVSAASIQFQANGYRHVSMRSLAKDLQCSHGALYYHFNNKAELFYEVVSFYFDKLNEQMNRAEAQYLSQDEKLTQLLLGYIEFGLNHQQYYEFMFMVKEKEIDALSKRAANESYDQFSIMLNKLSNQQASIADIYSTFIALHGFVAHYLYRVKDFADVQDAAQKHVHFLKRAIMN
ncbi:TetR/AcrR family transcriptional regulator [Bacillus sp. Marseille-P3800]|uniref:TetR/AcrR family transcriptional regulator n=1 Tax=Bacillus sp. Marseille-P3800 TaxID=2014782 RepID=UPI000C072C61|nr:TetR/AcrR family transcriptional regulator [Bacillus sp. Marseille-P3800]